MGRDFFPPLVSPVGASVLKQAVFLTDMKTNRDTLVRMNTVLTDMKQSSAQLRTSLRDVKTNMEQTLMDPQCSSPAAAPMCDSIRKSLSVLDGSANFDHVRRGQSCSRAVSLGRLGRLQRGSPTRGPVAGGRGDLCQPSWLCGHHVRMAAAGEKGGWEVLPESSLPFVDWNVSG